MPQAVFDSPTISECVFIDSQVINDLILFLSFGLLGLAVVSSVP